MIQALSDVADFPAGEVEVARLIRAHDWGATSVGPLADWSPSLRAIVQMIVLAPLPMVVLWGADGSMIYNQAFADSIEERHPDLLGRPVRDGWPEIRDFADHIMRVVLGGGTLSYRDRELMLMRAGELVRVWVNLDYSPLLDNSGKPTGVIGVISETTERVLTDRRNGEEQERLRAMFEQAPGFIVQLEGPEHVFALTNEAYERLLGARDFIGKRVRDVVPEAIAQGFVVLLDTAYRTGKPFVGEGFKLTLPDESGRDQDHYIDFVYQPVRDDAGAVSGIFVQGADVTERVLNEVALRKSQEEYHRLNDALIRANEILASARPASG